MPNPRIVLAYSGGLDTSIIVPWLRENYGGEVICVAREQLAQALAYARQAAMAGDSHAAGVGRALPIEDEQIGRGVQAQPGSREHGQLADGAHGSTPPKY